MGIGNPFDRMAAQAGKMDVSDVDASFRKALAKAVLYQPDKLKTLFEAFSKLADDGKSVDKIDSLPSAKTAVTSLADAIPRYDPNANRYDPSAESKADLEGQIKSGLHRLWEASMGTSMPAEKAAQTALSVLEAGATNLLAP